MKNYLLAGCSAAALALGASAAYAQSAPGKFELKMGGDGYFEAGFAANDASYDARTVEFVNRLRLVITPTAKADNGMTYGGRVRIRANAGTALVDGDRAFAFVEGNFGRIEAGVVNGPSDATYVGYPMDWQVLGLYDEWKRYINSTNVGTAVNPNGMTYTGGDNASQAWGQLGAPGVQGMQLLYSQNAGTKIVYYTPRWSGLQGGLSYMPRTGSVNTDVNRNIYAGASTAQQTTGFQDVWEVTANFDSEKGGLNLNNFVIKASGGYSGGSATNDATGGGANSYHDLSTWQLGAQIGYKWSSEHHVFIGGGYVDGGKSGYTKAPSVIANGNTAYAVESTAAGSVTSQISDMSTWNVGGQYTTGPIVAGISYIRQKDAGSLAVAGDRTLEAINVGVAYTVAPGLRTGLEWTNFEAKSDIASTATVKYNDNGNVVMLRGVLTF